jgi:hypothetical protein
MDGAMMAAVIMLGVSIVAVLALIVASHLARWWQYSLAAFRFRVWFSGLPRPVRTGRGRHR